MTLRMDYVKAAPEGIATISRVRDYVTKSGLPQTLIDLVYQRVSQINGCAYCLDMHARDLVKAGVPPEKLALLQVWREGGKLFDERERAALAWAETVTRVAETGVPDADYQAVAQHFNEKELADLTFAIALMNLLNRVAISFRATPQAAK